MGTGIGYMIPAIIVAWFFCVMKGSLYFRWQVKDISVLVKNCTNGFSEMLNGAAAAVTTLLLIGQ